MTQPNLFDPAASAAARDRGIRTAAQHADPQWKVDALGAVRWCATHYPEFTANEIWARIQIGATSTTHEPRALGAVMRAAQRRGIVTNTGRFVTSQLPRQHSRPIPVWRSLIYKKLAK